MLAGCRRGGGWLVVGTKSRPAGSINLLNENYSHLHDLRCAAEMQAGFTIRMTDDVRFVLVASLPISYTERHVVL
jgi:hypothetical protein